VRIGHLLALLVLVACAPKPRAPAQRSARSPDTVSAVAVTKKPRRCTAPPLHIDSAAAPRLIGTRLRSAADYYPWITQLSAGEVRWSEGASEDESSGCMYRVAVLVSEIYNTVLLEEVTLGQEGCCAELGKVRELDLQSFADAFQLPGELSGFAVGRWTAPDAFEFTYHHRQFRMVGVGRDTVAVYEVRDAESHSRRRLTSACSGGLRGLTARPAS